MKKILFTSGCSFTSSPNKFTDGYNSWPNFVSNKLKIQLLNSAIISQGNGLISRKVLYNIDKLLKKYKPDDILVGVMWSGVDRFDYYHNSSENFAIHNSCDFNPTSIIENHNNWRIMNHHWINDESILYYKHFHNDISSLLITIEHILRVQWYLKRLGVDYFMTTYMNIFDKKLIKHHEISYLYDMINFDKFLPVNGCYEWINEKYPHYINEYKHPIEIGYKKFTENIILPYLNNNMYMIK